MQVIEEKATNPLHGLISDEVYHLLESHSLLSEKGIRDFLIRARFKNLRDRNIPACDAIEMLREDYPYLQFDTVRKIVYKLNSKK